MSNEEDTRRLVLSIIDFFQNELTDRNDLSLEDRDSLRIAIECLELAYGLQSEGYVHRRSLMDMYSQVANPVSIKDKLQAELLKNDGNEKMTQEQFQQAEEDYTHAIELDRWNAIYFCNRAAARLNLGKFYEAISDCRQALVLNPDYAKAYGRMGQVYVQMNRPRRAASCFQHAVRLEPENQKYQNNLQVAQTQTTQATAMGMDNFIQNILSMIAGNESEGQEEGVPPGLRPFMILSEPHRAQDCSANNCDDSHSADPNDGSNSNPSTNQQVSEGNQNNSGNADDISENDTVHFRMLVGIPRFIVSEPDSNEIPENDAISSPLSESMNTNNGSELISGGKPEQPKVAGNNHEMSEAKSTALGNSKNAQDNIAKSPEWMKKDELKTTEDNARSKDSNPFKEIVESMTAGMSRLAIVSEDDSKKTPGNDKKLSLFSESKPTNGGKPIQEQPKAEKNSTEKSALNSTTFENSKNMEQSQVKSSKEDESKASENNAYEKDDVKEIKTPMTDNMNKLIKQKDDDEQDSSNTANISTESQPMVNDNDSVKSRALGNSKNVQENKMKSPEWMKKDESKTNGNDDRAKDPDPFKEIVESMTAGMPRYIAASEDDSNKTPGKDKIPSLFSESKFKSGEKPIQEHAKTEKNSAEKSQANSTALENSKNVLENQGKSPKEDKSKVNEDITHDKDSLKGIAKSMTSSIKNLIKQHRISDLLKNDGGYIGVNSEDIAVIGTSNDEKESSDKDTPGNEKRVTKRLESSSDDDKNFNPNKDEKEEDQGHDSEPNTLQNRVSSFFKKSRKSKSDKSKKSKEPEENQISSTKIEDLEDEKTLKESKDYSSD